MSEIIAKNETESKTQPWHSELCVVMLFLFVPIREILAIWISRDLALITVFLGFANIGFYLTSQNTWLHHKFENKIVRFLVFNLACLFFIISTFALAKYFAQYIKIPPIVAISFVFLGFFFLAGLVFYWITKSSKK